MERNFFGFYDEEQHRKLIKKFESMKEDGRVRFLDVDEFEELITTYLDSGDLDKAGMAIDAALKQHPAASSLQLLQADLLVRKNKMHDALETLGYLRKVEPEDPEAVFLTGVAKLNLFRFDEAFRCFSKAITMDVNGDAEMALRTGKQLADFHCYPQAITCFEKAIPVYADTIEIYYEIFDAWEGMGNQKMTRQWIYNFLDEEPFSADMWVQAAMYEYNLKNYSKAIEAVDFADALMPGLVLSMFMRARILGKMKKTDEAVAFFKFRVPGEISEDLANLLMAVAYAEAGEMKKALRKLPGNPELKSSEEGKYRLYSAIIYQGLGRDDVATALYESALEENTTDLDLLRKAYRFFRRKGDNEKALTILEQMVMADPFTVNHHRVLIDLTARLHPRKNLQELFKRALELMPGVADFHYAYATYLLHNGNEDKGLKYFRQGLMLDYSRHKIFIRKHPGLGKDSRIRQMINHYKTVKNEL